MTLLTGQDIAAAAAANFPLLILGPDIVTVIKHMHERVMLSCYLMHERIMLFRLHVIIGLCMLLIKFKPSIIELHAL